MQNYHIHIYYILLSYSYIIIYEYLTYKIKLYTHFQLRKVIDISNSQVAQKLITSPSFEITTKNSTIYPSRSHNAINGSSEAESGDPLFPLIFFFFFFPKPTAFSFIGGNSWSQRICLEAPHYRTLHIEKASSMHSSTALNTFNYPFRGSALSRLNSTCTVAHNRSRDSSFYCRSLSLVIHSIL